MSNVFENNESPKVLREATKHDGWLHAVLPVLPDNQEYELQKLTDGRVAVIVTKG